MRPSQRLLVVFVIWFLCTLTWGCGGGGASGVGSTAAGSGANLPTTSAAGKTGVALDISVKRGPALEGDVRLATAEDIQEVLIDFLDPTTLQPAVNTTLVARTGTTADVVIDVPVGTWILRIQGRTAAGEVAGSRFESTIVVIEGQTTEATAELNPATRLVTVDVTPGPSTQLVAGTSGQFTATGILSDLTRVPLTSTAQWSSSNPAIATVTSSGLVIAVGPGTGVITARSGGVQGSSTLTVTAPVVRELQVTPGNTTLSAGLTQQLTATAVLADSTNQNVTDQAVWTSSAPNVASVTNTGLVTAAAPGNTTIRARFGGREASAVIAVNPTLVRLDLAPANLTLPVGSSQSVRATGVFSNNSTQDLTSTVAWTSVNGAVATVSSAGEVVGVAAGTTSITASSGNVRATASVLVENVRLTRLSITPASASVPQGSTQPFLATGTFSNNSTRAVTDEVTWTSTSPDVFAISNANGTRGLGTAVKAGMTVVEATLDGINAAASVNVTPATLVTLSVAPPNVATASGNLVVFTATGTFSDGTTHDLTTNVTWTSGNVNVVTISNAAGTEGQAVSIAGGTTTITALFGNVTAATSFTTTVPIIPPTPSPATPSPSPLANVLVNYNSSNTDASSGPCDTRCRRASNADGTLVLFVGDGFNNLDGFGGATGGVFLRNTTTNVTTRLTPTAPFNLYGNPSISSNGRWVVFEAVNPLVPEDVNAQTDVYLLDRTVGTLQLVSANPLDPVPGRAAGGADGCSVSDDGRYVAFSCAVEVTASANKIVNVFLRDMTRPGTDPLCQELINVQSSGVSGVSAADQPEIARNGRYVTFRSNDNTLVTLSGPTANQLIFRRDTQGAGATELVSSDPSAGPASLPSISDDGSVIVYTYNDGVRDRIYARDMGSAARTEVSVTFDGQAADADGGDPTVSANGRFVTWNSAATNLVPGGGSGGSDIYVRDRTGALSAIALLTPRLAGSTNGCGGARISPDGRAVVFGSTAPDLLAGLTLVGQNVFRFANLLF